MAAGMMVVVPADFGQGGKPGVGNLYDSDARVDRAKGVIGRLRLARLGKGIEQGAFAYVGKAYYSCLEHDVLSEKKRKMNQEDEMVKDARPRRRAFLVDAIPLFFNLWSFVAIVAQLVRAPACGAGGRRFESGLSPHLLLWALLFLGFSPFGAGADAPRVTEALNLSYGEHERQVLDVVSSEVCRPLLSFFSFMVAVGDGAKKIITAKSANSSPGKESSL